MSAGSQVVRNPRFGSEVTQDWLEHMLTTYERRRDPEAAVQVINYEIKPGTKPGENVASELLKIWVEAKLTKERKKKEEEEEKENTSISTSQSTTTTTTKEYNLMAKFNIGNEIDREYVRYIQTDLNELLIYSHVMDELNAFQEQVAGGKYPVAIPEFVYGVRSGDEYVLVMQDVSVLGYKTEDKEKGLDLAHTLMAAEHLARLHALSHAYHQAHDFLKRYPSFEIDDNLSSFFADFVSIIYEGAVEIISDRPEFSPLAEKLRDNKDLLAGKLKEVISRNSSGHRVICLAHGDAWINNLMYRHGESVDGAPPGPQDLMIIDWGLVIWRNPILDLHQLVYNCTTLAFRRRHLQEVLEHYHGTFTAATMDLGAPVANYGLEEFLKEWKRTSVFGFVQAGIFANAIVLSQRAREAFVKGTMSSGIKGVVSRAIAKVMVPLILRGWLKSMIQASVKKNFQSVFEELRSGVNHTMNSTLIDVMMEAYENGVIDQ